MYKRVWLVAALFITGFFGILYIAIQQSLRLGANDPQVSIAQDVAAAVDRNRKPADILADHVEMAYSMAPFVIIYDKSGTVVSGNGYLNGEIPVIPYGVLQHTPKDGTHFVTWSPAKGVRIAAVSAMSRDYYIVSGRSLAVTEDHIRTVTQIALCAWLITMAGLAEAYIIANRPVTAKNGSGA
jgi:hypothetical protein